MKYSDEDIDKEIERLKRLKFQDKAKTKNDDLIEVGKTYYALNDLSKGFDEIIISNDWEFDRYGIRFRWNEKVSHKHYYDYGDLFISKKEAYENMKNIILKRISCCENEIKNNKGSLKLLEKLKEEI